MGVATRRAVRALCAASILVLGLHNVASGQAVSETALKAAFLLNFAKFTQWPAESLPAGAPLVLCSQHAGVASALESAAQNRVVHDHPITITRVTSDQAIRGCHLFYAGRVEPPAVAQLLDRSRGTSVLLVGDDRDFAIAGGAIGMFLTDGRMRFAINVSAAERGRLRLDPQLLNLADIIKD